MSGFCHNAGAAERGQVRCDIIQAEFRAQPKERRSIRREPPPTPAALVPTDDALKLRLAEELNYARRMLAAMGDELSSDGLIVSRYARALQAVDIVGQMLGHVAEVIGSSDPEGAVARIGMCEMKARLARRSVR